ncbi:MAG TPA: flagellar biosynthetic protein FliR, partial [Rhodoferax sp.]
MISFSEAQLTAWLSPLIWPFLRTLAVFTSAPI